MHDQNDDGHDTSDSPRIDVDTSSAEAVIADLAAALTHAGAGTIVGYRKNRADHRREGVRSSRRATARARSGKLAPHPLARTEGEAGA